MKRKISALLVALLLVTMLPTQAFARCNEVIHFDDGSYIVISISSIDLRASMQKNGNKTYTYYKGNGSVAWKAVLSATFTYTGSSSTCTSASCSVTIQDSSWYTISKSASKSGNTAYGYATVGEKVLGITVDEVPVTITLSCDANGNLS